MRSDRRFITLLILCFSILAPTPFTNAQQHSNQMLSSNPYQHVDDLSRNVHDEATVQALYQKIIGTTFFGPFPDSITSRMYRTELARAGVTSSPITEKSVADAVNYLGQYLGGSNYTGTNELQVHLLRIAMYRDIPHLLKSPTPPDHQKLVGPDMTPAGGAYIALLLLRQKLTNPEWFGDPDAQNQLALSYHVDPQAQARDSIATQVYKEPALSVAVRRKMDRDFKGNGNATISAFHRFLDLVGFDQ